jgi:hypothetical protein
VRDVDTQKWNFRQCTESYQLSAQRMVVNHCVITICNIQNQERIFTRRIMQPGRPSSAHPKPFMLSSLSETESNEFITIKTSTLSKTEISWAVPLYEGGVNPDLGEWAVTEVSSKFTTDFFLAL